ncbi:MAG: hypothetical protein K2Y28_03955 [Burkholderiaceae bacterium]|nr:hypothetical protein [Burkholderiaceae bacterium]
MLDEARRDLVFFWNIQRGNYGGSRVAPDKKTLEKVVEGLVTGNCLVGFGDPSFPTWNAPPELQVSRDRLSAAVIQFCELNQKESEFITFAKRENMALKLEEKSSVKFNKKE